MAQNQATGGNSMAATLGNLQNRTQRPGQPQRRANYGAGMQAPMQGQGQVYRGPVNASGQPMQAPGTREDMGGGVTRFTPQGGWGGQPPIPPGGAGYPQMSPDAMQNMMGQISQLQQQKRLGAPPQQLQSGAPGNMLGGITQGPASLGGALGNMTQGPASLGQMPRRPMGAPGMGAGGGKGQQIAGLPGGPGGAPGPLRRMGPPPGAPGAGAGGQKAQQAAQLPGGPPMGR